MTINGALIYGLAIVLTFVFGVLFAVYRKHRRISVRLVLSFESVPRYVLAEMRREGAKGLLRPDLLSFLISFSLIALMFILPILLALSRRG